MQAPAAEGSPGGGGDQADDRRRRRPCLQGHDVAEAAGGKWGRHRRSRAWGRRLPFLVEALPTPPPPPAQADISRPPNLADYGYALHQGAPSLYTVSVLSATCLPWCETSPCPNGRRAADFSSLARPPPPLPPAPADPLGQAEGRARLGKAEGDRGAGEGAEELGQEAARGPRLHRGLRLHGASGWRCRYTNATNALRCRHP